MHGLLFLFCLPFFLIGCIPRSHIQNPVNLDTSGSAEPSGPLERYGEGRYLVAEVERRQDKALSFLRIIFHKQGQEFHGGQRRQSVDRFWFDTGHLYPGIKEGRIFKVHYSGVETSAGFEAMQILVFLSDEQGGSPVWLLSKRNRKMIDFSQGSFLRMHAPASDYLIF